MRLRSGPKVILDLKGFICKECFGKKWMKRLRWLAVCKQCNTKNIRYRGHTMCLSCARNEHSCVVCSKLNMRSLCLRLEVVNFLKTVPVVLQEVFYEYFDNLKRAPPSKYGSIRKTCFDIKRRLNIFNDYSSNPTDFNDAPVLI